MFIRIGIRKTRETLTTLLVQVRNFYYLLDFKVFDTRRERHNFYYADFHLAQKTRARTPQQTTGLASLRLESQLASSMSKSQLTAFIQNHKESQPIASGHDVIHIPISYFLSGVFIVLSVNVISSPRAREHLR